MHAIAIAAEINDEEHLIAERLAGRRAWPGRNSLKGEGRLKLRACVGSRLAQVCQRRSGGKRVPQQVSATDAEGRRAHGGVEWRDDELNGYGSGHGGRGERMREHETKRAGK